MMDKCAPKLTFSCIGFTILLLTVSQCTSWPRAGSIGKLSHFEGRKADSDLNCESRLVGKKTPVPAQISFTSQLPITAYSAEATKYHRHGFTISIQTGALNTNAIGLVVNGPKTLPYAVLVKLYCGSTPMDNGKITELSHSEGMKGDDDFFCGTKTALANEPLESPAQVSLNLSGSSVITAYMAVASGSKDFTVIIESGGFGTGSIVLSIDVPGATTLPYDVEVSFYCRFEFPTEGLL